MSRNSQPARALPAISSHGNPPAASICFHTCLRTLALACAIRVSARSSARFRVRRTVEPLGAAPSTGASWPSTSMSAIAVAPSAIAIAVDARATPRLKCGDAPFCVSAASSSAVRPHWSASLRSKIPPPWPTRPFPSAVTSRAWSQDVSFIAKSAPVWKLQVWLPRNLPKPGRSSLLKRAIRQAARLPGLRTHQVRHRGTRDQAGTRKTPGHGNAKPRHSLIRNSC